MSLGRKEKIHFKVPEAPIAIEPSKPNDWITVTGQGTWSILPDTQSLEGIIRNQRAEELQLANKIIDATVGPGACSESRYALAIKYNVEQLTKLMDCIKQL